MKKKILIPILAILLTITLFGCTSLGNTISNALNNTIDTTYGLNTVDLSNYTSDTGNSTVVNAAIGLASTVEVTVDFEYSYSQTQFTPFGGASTKTVTDNATSLATGFFIDSEGYILTNAHVVTLEDYEDLSNFKYDSISVSVNYAESNVTFAADVIAYDQSLDLAVLQVEASKIDNVQYLTFLNLTDPSTDLYQTNNAVKLLYGETVITVGNAYGYGLSVTEGIISAPLRYFNDNGNVVKVIQTDTAINSGNSGGPLLNQNGNVVGIISFKIASDTAENLGYAIPSYVILEYIDSLNLNINYSTIS